MDRVTTFVAVALGSNLGDRRAHLSWAVDELAPRLLECGVSSIVETEPVGTADVQPPFLNAVVVGRTTLDPLELLDLLQDLENRRGRERPFRWAPRTLDLDLILYGDQVLNMPRLVVPHPLFRDRRFVLEPLSEVVPDAVDPVTGRTVGELFQILTGGLR